MKKYLFILSFCLLVHVEIFAAESCVVNASATCVDFVSNYSQTQASEYCSKMSGGDFRLKQCPTGGSVYKCSLNSSSKVLNMTYYSEKWTQTLATSHCGKLQEIIAN